MPRAWGGSQSTTVSVVQRRLNAGTRRSAGQKKIMYRDPEGVLRLEMGEGLGGPTPQMGWVGRWGNLLLGGPFTEFWAFDWPAAVVCLARKHLQCSCQSDGERKFVPPVGATYLIFFYLFLPMAVAVSRSTTGTFLPPFAHPLNHANTCGLN